MWNCFWIIPSCWIICFRKISLLINLHRKNVKLGFSGKLDPGRDVFRTRNIFWIEDFEKRVSFWINFFTTHQILKWLWFSKKQIWWKLSFQKITFGCFYTVRTPKFVDMRFSKRMILGKKNFKKNFEMMTFEKNQILKQLFNDATDFESRFPKRVRFLANFTRLNRLLIEGFTGCQVLKWNLYIASDFEVKRIHLRVSKTS